MLQMLRENLFLLLELVHTRQGMSSGSLIRWGSFCGCLQRGAVLCPCLHRHQPSAPAYPLRPVRVPSDPTRFIPSTAPLLQRDLHAPGALRNLTAQHPRGNPWVAEVPSPLWGLALGRGPKGGVLLRPFPTAGPGIPRGHRAEGHIPRRS